MTSGANLGRELRATAALAAPVVAGQVAHVGMGFVDTLMAGHYAPAALAAVAVGSSVWIVLLLFLLGTLAAVTPQVAQLRGAGRGADITHLTRQALWLSQLIGWPAAALLVHAGPLLDGFALDTAFRPQAEAYLGLIAFGLPGYCAFLALRFVCEGMGLTALPMRVGYAGLALNTLGNALLMFGLLGFPEMGVRGCALATTLSWWGMAAMLLPPFLRGRLHGLGVFDGWEPPRAAGLAAIVHVGLPIGVSYFLEVSLFSAVALLMGGLGVVEAAAHQIAINFAALVFMVPVGIAIATSVRVGHALGAGDREGARRAGWAGIGLALLTNTVSALGIALGHAAIAGLYTADAAVAALGAQLLLYAAAFQIPDGLQASAAGALRGWQDTPAIMGITLLAYWGVGFPAAYVFGVAHGGGPQGLWLGLIAGLAVAAAGLLARYAIRSRRPG